MEDLIAQIQEKTGLSADKVLEVVTIVTEYLKERLPDDLVAQITTYLAEAAGAASEAAASAGSIASDVAASVTEVATDAVEKFVDTTAAVISKAVESVNQAVASNGDE